LGEAAAAEKSNEITAMPQLLDLLDIKGDVVMADAIHCQKDTVKRKRVIYWR
jgi:predicted transposase YbfD/YdcC